MALGLGSILGLLGGGLGLGGAALGLGKKGISKFLSGTPGQEQQFQKFTPDQQSALDQLLQQGLGETDFGGIEDLARKRFSEDTIPSIAERFTAMGGGQRSSAFESSLGRAGSDLEAQLAALRPQMGMQKLSMGMQPRFDTGYTPGSPGAMQGLGGSLGSILPMLLKLLGGM